MGLRLFSGGSPRKLSGPMVGSSLRSAAEKRAEERHPLEPDPARWTLTRHAVVGNGLVIEVNYPNCTNYEGNKVLVFRGVTLDTIKARTDLDPHFLETGLSPVARFVPTEEGWALAMKFALML